MDIQRWEKVCRDSQVKPERMTTTDRGVIYLGERYSNGNNDFREPHFMTLWAVAKGQAQIARGLYFKFGPGMPDKGERLAAAEQDAWGFLND